MIAGKKYHGLDVDIWSCGVILFALVCGYLPFEDPNTAHLYKKILNGDFTIPKFVSEECTGLMKKILSIDPSKRFKVEDIKSHKWFNLWKNPSPNEVEDEAGIIIGVNKIPIEAKIIDLLEQYGFKKDYAIRCLNANKHNHVTTTYYLLLQKMNRIGGIPNSSKFSL